MIRKVDLDIICCIYGMNYLYILIHSVDIFYHDVKQRKQLYSCHFENIGISVHYHFKA